MRILIAGASGVLGRATLPHLAEHRVYGLTRRQEGSDTLEHLGAEALVCDVYDAEALLALTLLVRPQIVVNFLTALAEGAEENTRIRRHGSPNLRRAAEAVRARRLVVESVAFRLDGDAGRAVEELERSTLQFPGEAVVLRFGRLWGPGTMYETPPRPPAVHIADAGARAATLVTDRAPGTHDVV